MSVVYVFDVSAYPFVHVPLYLLTALYLTSILEIYGMFRLGRWVGRGFARLRRRANELRAVSQVSTAIACLFSVRS